MIIDPSTTAGSNFVTACLDNARNPLLFIHCEITRGPVSPQPEDIVTFDISDIKRFEITDTVSSASELSVGNLGVVSVVFDAYMPSDPNWDIGSPANGGEISGMFYVYFAPRQYENAYGQPVFDKSYISALNGATPSDPRIIKIGDYLFQANVMYWDDGVLHVEMTGYIKGEGANDRWNQEYVPTLTVSPYTVGDIFFDALKQATGNLYPITGSEATDLLNASVEIAELPEGYTNREILQNCLACMGANLFHDFAKSGEYRVMYPARTTYHQLNGSTIEGYILNEDAASDTVSITQAGIFSVERLKYKLKYEGVQYGDIKVTATGATATNCFLSVPQNIFFDGLSTAQLNAALLRIANVYRNFSYTPANLKINSFPFIQPSDRVIFRDRVGNIYRAIPSSLNMIGISQETLTSPGSTIPTNRYANNPRNTSSAKKAQSLRTAKNADDITTIQRYLDVSDDSAGIFTDSRSITTTSTGYYQYTDYGRDNYRLLSVYETGVSNGYVVITASVSGQYVRVFQASGTAAASSTVTLNAVFLKIT